MDNISSGHNAALVLPKFFGILCDRCAPDCQSQCFIRQSGLLSHLTEQGYWSGIIRVEETARWTTASWLNRRFSLDQILQETKPAEIKREDIWNRIMIQTGEELLCDGHFRSLAVKIELLIADLLIAADRTAS